ncbi:MAG TPA: RNA polymerase sporulation sigma factor SigF [Clostridia bacterium]|nr:RNA polymerase sporulation sigma factor SigF [Clostridia bacterium]
MELINDMTIHELIYKAQNGDDFAKSKIVENNIRLVWSVVKRFTGRGHENEDLFQIGCMGLVKAINKFDFSYDVKFSTYAVPLIIGEIKRFIRDDGIIKVSRSLKEISARAGFTREIMRRELDRDPTINEIAERIGVKPEDLVMAMEASSTPESLFSDITGKDGKQVFLIDRISADGRVDGNENELVDKIVLKQVINSLPPREKQIIFLRYFKEKTQSQIAKILGVSQVHVSRIEKKVLEDLRRKIV